MNLDEKPWIEFANVYKFAEFNLPNGEIRKKIIQAFSKNFINHQNLAIPGFSLLKLNPKFQSLLHLPYDLLVKQISSFESLEIFNDTLFINLLSKTILPDPQLETFLTLVRKVFLNMAVESNSIVEEYLPFLYGLALYCFHTEYVFIETEDEKRKISQLGKASKGRIAILAAYRILQEYPAIQEIWDMSFNTILKEQITNKEKEQILQNIIPSIGSIQDEVSKKVAQQYEENPYPRWSSIEKNQATPFPNISTVLVAGCGTGYHALSCALTYKNAQVLAIDLSRVSLAYAMRKAEEMEIKNIQFMQADILDLSKLNQTFNLIECSGVLHHMKEPIKGWKILVDLLRPQGIMNIGLYSEIARQDVVAVRDYIQKKGYQPNLEGIRATRQDIMARREFESVTKTIDFYSASGCRDFLFHVQEHRFTLKQIQTILNELQLELIGFELRDPRALGRYLERFPNDPQALSLENWDEFEKLHPETFIGMYHLLLTHKSI